MIKIYTTGLLLIITAFLIGSDKPHKYHTYGNIVITDIVNVYDGDTVHVNIKDWPDIVGKNIGIRVIGIDAPEMHDTNPIIKAKAIESREFLKNLLSKSKKIELKNIGRDKYFRLLGELWTDDNNVADIMIKNGYAKEYYGGTKEKWEESK